MDGEKENPADIGREIIVDTNIRKQYKVYSIQQGKAQTLREILAALGKNEEDGDTEKLGASLSVWTYDDGITGEYIAACIEGKEKNVIEFSYQTCSDKDSITATMGNVWEFPVSFAPAGDENNLEFAPVEYAVEKTKKFLENIGFSNIGLYRYSAMDGKRIETIKKKNRLDTQGQQTEGQEAGYYYMVFTPEVDGIPCFTTQEQEYRRWDLINKSASAPSLECYYDEDGLYMARAGTAFFSIKNEIGLEDVISYEEALQKAEKSMDYMEEALKLAQGKAAYHWNRAGIEYIPYQTDGENREFQYIPAWVFRGEKEENGTVSEAYLLLDAGTGEVLSESR